MTIFLLSAGLTLWIGGITIVGYWVLSGMIERRKVEFDTLDVYRKEQEAKIQIEVNRAAQEFSQIAVQASVGMCEQIGRIMLETVPEVVKQTVQSVYESQRDDLKQKAIVVAEMQEAANEKMTKEQEDDYSWYYRKDEDYPDPFDEFTETETNKEFAPTEGQRVRNERRVSS